MEVKTAKIYVEAKVDGRNIAVQDATVSLAVNAIPEVTLSCAPSRIVPQPLKPKEYPPDMIEYFSDLYRELGEKAMGLSTKGDVDMVIEYSDGTKDEVHLKDWILSGVGMSGVGATRAPYLSAVLQHPICKLTQVGSIYETPKTGIDRALNEAIGGGEMSLLDVMDTVYECINSDAVEFYEPPNDFPPLFRAMLGKGDYDHNKYLNFEQGEHSTGIFLDISKMSGKSLRQAIARTVLPRFGSSSTWDMLVSAAGTQMLNIVQNDYLGNFTGDKLVLEPIQPWKKTGITLDEKMCSSTDLPGMDPFRLAGVMADRQTPMLNFVNQGTVKNGNESEDGEDKIPSNEVMYCPFDEPSVADGKIMKVPFPPILASAIARDAACGETISQGTVGNKEEMGMDFNDVLESYCKAVYEITAASMVRASATMVPCFRDSEGKLILPGETCVLMSGGKPLYYGNIRKVVHHLSVEGNNATVVSMSYVRPDEDLKINGKTAIKMGAPNAAYS